MNKVSVVNKILANSELKKELIEELFSQKISKNKFPLFKALGRALGGGALNYVTIFYFSVLFYMSDSLERKEVLMLYACGGFLGVLFSVISVVLSDDFYNLSSIGDFIKKSLLFLGVKKDFIKFKYNKPISLAGLNVLKKYLSSDEMKILLADKDNKLTYNSFNLQVFQQEQEERLKIEQHKKKSGALVDNMYKNNV